MDAAVEGSVVVERVRAIRVQLRVMRDGMQRWCVGQGQTRAELVALCGGEQWERYCMDSDRFSLRDLEILNDGTLETSLSILLRRLVVHMSSECGVCRANSEAYCRLCSSPTPVYPWMLGEWWSCEHCGVGYHRRCVLQCERQGRQTICLKCGYINSGVAAEKPDEMAGGTMSVMEKRDTMAASVNDTHDVNVVVGPNDLVFFPRRSTADDGSQ